MAGKAIVVTGGSRGIGRACALLAADRGWSVAIGYRGDARAAAATVADVQARGGRAVAARGDVADEADLAQLFDQAEAAFGPLSGVVVNAGVVAPAAQLADMSAERLRRLFEINVLGAYLTAREAARRLSVERGGPGGAIVLVSSAAARLGSPFEYVDYAGSKAAIDTLTIGLSKELGGQGVRVNAVRPGLIETDRHPRQRRPAGPRPAPGRRDPARPRGDGRGGGRGDCLAAGRRRRLRHRRDPGRRRRALAQSAAHR